MNSFFSIKVGRVSICHFFKKWVFISFLFGFLGLSATNQTKKKNVTIFVHGIISITPHLSVSNFFRFLNDRIENTIYFEATKLMRDDEFFFQNQAMLGRGLHKIDSCHNRHIGASLLSRLMDSIKTNTTHTDYYTFGWSGLMSSSERLKASEQLQKAIIGLQLQYKKENITPKISVIGYSHGATVTLNLGLIAQNKKLKPLHKVILLGMPIPVECYECLAQIPAKDVYHIYSRADRIQAHDIFSSGNLFNPQCIKKKKKITIPNNLHQIELRITRARKGSKKISKKVTGNFSNRRILLGNSKCLRCASPGHFEFWFFGWPSSNYTRLSGLYPLPIVTFVPYIIEQIKKYDHIYQSHEPLIVDLRVENHKMVIRNKCKKNIIYTADFLDSDNLQSMRAIAWNSSPKDYTSRAVKKRMKQNYLAGQKLHLQTYKKCKVKLVTKENNFIETTSHSPLAIKK